VVSGDKLRQLLVAGERAGSSYVDTIVVAEDLHLLIAPGQPIHYGNHSCDPNLWWASPYTLIARRPIEAGDEVTSDYGTSTGTDDFLMTCTCGCALCRGRVTGTDWRRPDLQERYGNHWVPALRARIANDT
jgi:hypothetical protein